MTTLSDRKHVPSGFTFIRIFFTEKKLLLLTLYRFPTQFTLLMIPSLILLDVNLKVHPTIFVTCQFTQRSQHVLFREGFSIVTFFCLVYRRFLLIWLKLHIKYNSDAGVFTVNVPPHSSPISYSVC